MGKIDSEAKNYFSKNDRFADVFNYVLYDGKPVIVPERLHPLDSAEVVIPYGNHARQREQKTRDLLKSWQVRTDGEAVYAVALGVEAQSHVHYAMPVKCGLYDFMYYSMQVEEAAHSYKKKGERIRLSDDGKGEEKDRVHLPDEKKGTAGEQVPLDNDEFLSGFRKDDKLIPVITLTIVLGNFEWDGPHSIKEMLNTRNPRILEHVQDYKIRLLAPNMLSDEDFGKFTTDIGQVMEYIKYSKNKTKLMQVVSNNERYSSLEPDAAGLINNVTNSKLKLTEKEGKVDMCLALQEMRQEALEEGHVAGIEEMNSLYQWLLNNDRIDDLKHAAFDKEYRSQLFREFSSKQND